ncbi:MAG: O-linked N-acetylglucosamine transferase, SPINDLY family protein [Leptolyngbyaceae cyanobacterium bins.59]|nr:O-linked N-acetylglucosamine transferase, SPINDLY family protein [Leptolyngbyaceae cyanobacterium bins.59]
MTLSPTSPLDSVNLSHQAHAAFLEADYVTASHLYEQAIEQDPESLDNYWYLGLALLLQGQEMEAQTTWFLAMAEGEPETVEAGTGDLVAVLSAEADRLKALENLQAAWVIRQHIGQLAPENLANQLQGIQLGIGLETFEPDTLQELSLLEALQQMPPGSVPEEWLLDTIAPLIDYAPAHEQVLNLLDACLPHVSDGTVWVERFTSKMFWVGYQLWQSKAAARIGEFCLQLSENALLFLGHLTAFYQKAGEYERAIETARQYYEVAQQLPESIRLAGEVFGKFLVLRTLLVAGGHWEEAQKALKEHQQLMTALIESPTELTLVGASCLFTSTYFLPYLVDDLRQNRYFHNEITALCQRYTQSLFQEQVEQYRQRHLAVRQSPDAATKTLRLGYVSSCLRQHSVGWLARWLFKHHDSENFQIYLYLINQAEEGFTDHWFAQHATQTHHLKADALSVANQMHEDGIDIAIDLDSLTLDTSCEVFSLKPAPVQVTWLGWDASGNPAIDYYIADPYVLPDHAQDSYREKIWRMPTTYLAVDGFEIGVPDLRREDLGIPTEAVVYLSAQQGHKRNPQTARLQMQILKQVPGSHFLIKGVSDEEIVKAAFTQLAREEGVELDRLHFLPRSASEIAHRANLSIADVVLDTYPYNGATTTLETLWAGVPLVTRVGEHFSSRNSYTFMVNAGLEEGIAWTDAEYVEWGVRLGLDPALRQRVMWKLRVGRQSAPVWNGKTFTRDLEQAYREMWQRYLHAG